MTKRTKLLWGLITIVVVLIAFFALKGGEKQAPAPATLPLPKIPSQTQDSLKITLDVSESSFDFPQNLSALQFSTKVLDAEEVERIAEKLDFEGDPTIFEGKLKGVHHIYTNSDYSFSAALEAGEYSYIRGPVENVINKQLSEEAITKIAEDFLVDNGFVEKGQIQFASLTHYKTDSVESFSPISKDQATFSQVNFTPSASDIKTLSLNPQSSPIYVRILPDGSIQAAEVIVFEGVRETLENYQIKEYLYCSSFCLSSVFLSLLAHTIVRLYSS